MYDELLDDDTTKPTTPYILPSMARPATLWLLVALALLYAPFSWEVMRGPISGGMTIGVYGVLLLMILLFSAGLTWRALLHNNWILRTYAIVHLSAWVWGMAFFILEGNFVHLVGIALGGSLLLLLAELHRQYTPEPWLWKGLLLIVGVHFLECGGSALAGGYERWQMDAVRGISVVLYVCIGGYTFYQVLRYWRAHEDLRAYAVGGLLGAWILAGIWNALFHYREKIIFDPETFEELVYWAYPPPGTLPMGCWLLYVVGLAAAVGARRQKMVPFDYPE